MTALRGYQSRLGMACAITSIKRSKLLQHHHLFNEGIFISNQFVKVHAGRYYLTRFVCAIPD